MKHIKQKDLEYLGKSRRGYTYWYNPADFYVYSWPPVDSFGKPRKCTGWVCSFVVWEQTFAAKILVA